MYKLCTYGRDFKKKRNIRSVILGAPRTSTLPFICDTEGNPIPLVRSAEALVYDWVDYVPFSKYKPAGLRPHFTARQIRTGRIRFPSATGMWGLMRKRSRGNQENYLNGLCVYLPVTAREMPTDSRKMVSSGACVQFQTILPKLIVQLSWDSDDDFDLFLREPSGNVINLRRRRSDSGGKKSRDLHYGECGSVGMGWDDIVWSPDSSPMPGRYKMKVEQNVICNSKPTKWQLKVTYGGKTVLDQSGTSFSDIPNVVHKTGFAL